MDLSKTDFSQLSDAALEEISKGEKADLSKLPDSDLQIMAGPEPDKGTGPKADGSMRKLSEVNWLSAIGNELIHGHAPEGTVMGTPFDNPAIAFSSAPALVGSAVQGAKAAYQVGRAGASAIGRKALEFAKDAAPIVAGEIFDKAADSNLGKTVGINAAILRRILKKGK